MNYYRNPKNPKTLQKYQKILMTTGINGDNGNTCSAYWSKVFRDKFENLQDAIAP